MLYFITVEILEEVLEKELEEAVEVKNKEALKKYVKILVSSFSSRSDIIELKTDIKVLAETMKQGFELMEKRFDDMAKMFRTIMGLIEIGFVVMNALIVIFKFLG